MVWQPNILNNCYELSGGYASPEPPTRGSVPGLRWGDFRSPDPLCPHLQILAATLSKVLTSADSDVQVSAAYSKTDTTTSVWHKGSLMSSVRRLSLHIRFRDVMTERVFGLDDSDHPMIVHC